MIDIQPNTNRYPECLGCGNEVHRREYKINISRSAPGIPLIVTLCEDCLRSLVNNARDALKEM